MHFPELEPYKTKNPRLSELINSLDSYLYDLLSISQQQDIAPVLFAKKAGIDEPTALVLLMFAEDAGIILRKYYVYCPVTDDYIDSYSSPEDLPKEVYCPQDRKMHSYHEYLVELTFQFSAKALPIVSNI